MPHPKKQINVNDMQNMDWLKNVDNLQFPSSLDTTVLQPQKIQNLPQEKPKERMLVTEVKNGLRLQELKEMIAKNPHVVVEFESLIIEKVIGSGSAGEVYLGKYQDRVIAIKKVKTLENPNALKEFERELVTFIKMKEHANLVSLIGLSRS